MVDALVTFALENLKTLITDEVNLLKDVTKELEQLSGTFTAIQAVLEDAEMKRADKSAGIWLEDLKDVAYDVDDALDEWMIETHRLRLNETRSDMKVCLFFPPTLSSRHIKLRRRLGRRIKEIKERLSDIEKKKSQFKFFHGRPIEIGSPPTFSEINETKTFGRNRERETIVGELLRYASKETDIPIIPIVGMGGLGKTTLAQLLYNDTRVKNHFDKRMWVCVSSNFDVRRIASEMIEALEQETGSKFPPTNVLETLRYRLKDVLSGKRVLLVLDDVWHEGEESWETMLLLLKGAARGSRILATTRNEKVALKMGATRLHHLDPMSLADSWLLFSQRAFNGRTREEYSMLEETGKEIVKKCKGVPLAVKTVGCALRFQKTEEEWERVLKSKTWDLPDVEDGIYPALLLSYYFLPSHLKQCFVYSSLFPKGWVIDKDTLVKLWVSQGFIRSKGSRDMEEIGRDYFDDLLGRSFFENGIKDDEGNIMKCKMHELMHDLAQFVSKGEFSIEDTAQPSQTKARHSSLVGVNGSNLVAYKPDANKLRSLLLIGESDFSQLPPALLHGLSRIRTFCCANNNIESLPSPIDKLMHVRHLDFSHTPIQELPEALTNLYRLQTLRLNGCSKLRKLPQEMRKIVSLRHLEVEGTPQLCLPEKIGNLTALRTLSKFTEQGRSGYSIKELKELNLLRGKLEILNLELVRSGDEAKEAGIINKQHLHALYLNCKVMNTEDIKNLPEGENAVARIQSVLEGLRPNENLKVLKIMNYAGNEPPSWLVDTRFRNLVNVELTGFIKCQQLPALGRLPALRHLLIQNMPKVTSVGFEFIGGRGGFRKLEKLVFAHMYAWEEWHLRKDDQALQSLSLLEIHHCKKLKGFPGHIPERLKELSIEECSEIKWNQRLPQLQKLVLEGSVGKFTKSLPSLPNLESLEILGVKKMKSLPDGLLELKELQKLNISFCEQVSVLPKGMTKLSKLKKLAIRGCPALAERCQKGTGEDWKKIEFIPTIEIDWKKIQWPLPIEGQVW